MKPTFFRNTSALRRWFEKYHDKKTELIVGYYKVGTGKPSVTWSESVDQAICFGWIDGVRRTINQQSYQIRFTPRKPGSIWSDINIKKVKQLTSAGLMHTSGLAKFKFRKKEKSRVYSYEKPADEFSPEMEKQFKANRKAWKYFQELAPGYRRTSIHWIMSAKQPATQAKRMKTLIEFSAKGKNPWKDHQYK